MTFSIYWCGSLCAPSLRGFATKEEAEKALQQHIESGMSARNPMYGSFSIKEDR